MDEAVANHAVLGAQLTQEGSEDDGPLGARLRAQIGAVIREAKAREFNTLGVVLGCHYAGSPLVVGDGSAPPAAEVGHATPSASPGSLAPHAWLEDGSSLYDGFGLGFTLLASGGWTAADLAQAQQDAASLGIPLTTWQPSVPALDQLYQARLTLIRPDQHVAWRGDAWPHDGPALLRQVCGL